MGAQVGARGGSGVARARQNNKTPEKKGAQKRFERAAGVSGGPRTALAPTTPRSLAVLVNVRHGQACGRGEGAPRRRVRSRACPSSAPRASTAPHPPLMGRGLATAAAPAPLASAHGGRRRTRRQRLLQLLRLVGVLHAQRVEVAAAADLELGHARGLLNLNGCARGGGTRPDASAAPPALRRPPMDAGGEVCAPGAWAPAGAAARTFGVLPPGGQEEVLNLVNLARLRGARAGAGAGRVGQLRASRHDGGRAAAGATPPPRDAAAARAQAARRPHHPAGALDAERAPAPRPAQCKCGVPEATAARIDSFAKVPT